jgi:hypothetical protein
MLILEILEILTTQKESEKEDLGRESLFAGVCAL